MFHNIHSESISIVNPNFLLLLVGTITLFSDFKWHHLEILANILISSTFYLSVHEHGLDIFDMFSNI